VTLHEAATEIGGQFRLAARIPGKEDYGLFLAAYRRQLDEAGVQVRTGTAVSIDALVRENYDDVVISTGVVPRVIDIPGCDDPRVVGYSTILDGACKAGDRVVVIGGGGIGHDVALYLASGEDRAMPTIDAFAQRWGIGGPRHAHPSRRRVTMVKRSPGPFGRTLGKSTGWIVRQELKDLGVRQISGARYLRIDAAGLHVDVDGTVEVLEADTIVVCAGQESARDLADRLEARGQNVHVIGGARLAGELDAKRAIYEGASIANAL
jgi:2,4-dienoyl-CoA reductase (NADPH2)